LPIDVDRFLLHLNETNLALLYPVVFLYVLGISRLYVSCLLVRSSCVNDDVCELRINGKISRFEYHRV